MNEGSKEGKTEQKKEGRKQNLVNQTALFTA